MMDISVFDKILTHKGVNQRIVANTYLHILSTAHPAVLENYNLSMKGKILASIRAKLLLAIRVFQSVFDSQHHYVRERSVKSDVLFVSHLTNDQQLLQNNDAYFGDLPNQLFQNGVNSSVVLINHTKVSKNQVLNGWVDSKVHRFILSSSLDFMSEIKSYLAQLKSKKQLRLILKDLRVDKMFAQDVLRNHLSPATFNTLRIAKQVSDIVSQTGVKFVVVTYEGHAWERLVYYWIRKVNPDIKCFGYQHSAVFEHQRAIKRPLRKEYNPDVILTSGVVSQALFRKIQILESDIVCLGSPKHSPTVFAPNKGQRCLVAAQGEVTECLILFGFSLNYAKQHPGQSFVWRLHPIISFEKLKKYSAIFDRLPHNIHLSKESLEKDIEMCSSILYRGTTIVVNAINAGLKPIYYQQTSDELSIDPIYTHKKGKSIVHNQEELSLALDRDIDAKTMQSLQDFAQDFYTPLDVSALLRELGLALDRDINAKTL